MIAKTEREFQILRNSLERELKLIEYSIQKTTEKLKDFEKKHGISSEEFHKKFEKGEIGDSQEFMLWASEFEALELLKKDRDAIIRMLKLCR
ncbi:hypothetical protein [Archaeoglobus neptunius]|uniref:hypothetical protein n=1 Tax=Archaeoglobus neptunius TaxID=2798580 RepID=UPI0019293888|nr:hypothetical protein [Archaeoglobus neptunius]